MLCQNFLASPQICFSQLAGSYCIVAQMHLLFIKGLFALPIPLAAVCCRWRAYFTSGSSAAYLFLYSMFYFWTKLDITRYVPMVMYFGYMAIVSYGFFCMTGTIGFFACWLFVRQIYAAVKID